MDDKDLKTRRNVLKGIAIVAGGVVGSSVGMSPWKAAHAAGCPGTVPKATMQYQDTPKGKEECDNCGNFIAPKCCKVVAGPIAKKGWCMAYVPQ